MAEAGSYWVVARLFVSGDSAYSVIALAHLRDAISKLVDFDAPDVEIIDVQTNPLQAIHEHVYVTPTLQIIAHNLEHSSRRASMVGDLSDPEGVSAFLTAALQQTRQSSVEGVPSGG